MKYHPDKHHRRSIRLKHYDYSTPGAYFITICTHQRQCLFGEIVNGEMQLNSLGQLVSAYWQRSSHHFSTVALDAFIVMPNHLHGIVILTRSEPDVAFGREIATNSEISLPNAAPLQVGSVGAIILNFKSVTTRRINQLRKAGTPVWQRNYYDRIIRDQHALENIQTYIHNNPLSWQHDQLHPDNSSNW